MNPIIVAGLVSVADEVAALALYTLFKKEPARPPQYPKYVVNAHKTNDIVKDYLKQKS